VHAGGCPPFESVKDGLGYIMRVISPDVSLYVVTHKMSESGTIVSIRCNTTAGYAPFHSVDENFEEKSMCYEGKWSNRLLECVERCPSITNATWFDSQQYSPPVYKGASGYQNRNGAV
jgi:hypothetical protein